MTASDEHRARGHLLADVFVYAPIGLATEVLETFPRLVKRGRERAKLVRLIGHVAVTKGQRRFEGAVRQVFEPGGPTPTADGASMAPDLAMPDTAMPDSGMRDSDVDTGVDELEMSDSDLGDVEQPIVVRHLHAAYDFEQAALLAIPDYDSLSASQVVPRLAGLTTEELEAVRLYEASHRARRTILGRVAQLQQSA